MNKRLLKRHKRQVSRAKERARLSQPDLRTPATLAGESITIAYSSPSVRGRQIFGDGGLVSRDSTYPVWRAGADAATALRTGADLDIAGLNVPAGTYTLYALVEDTKNWKLIINNYEEKGMLERLMDRLRRIASGAHGYASVMVPALR